MNAETKHTPGPWFAELDDSDPFGAVEIYAQAGDEDEYLFTISNPHDDAELALAYMPTLKAIAALATAAPEMAEALRRVVSWKDAVSMVAPELGGLLTAMYAAEAVLKKAGG